MKCPHCQVSVHEVFGQTNGVTAGGGIWTLQFMTCPACQQAIIRAHRSQGGAVQTFRAYPAKAALRPVPVEVPDPYKRDFIEACDVIESSPKASAALSRRNLQAILRECARTKKRELAEQIDEVIAVGHLPTHIQESLDAVRTVGNFAAHPTKSTSTGEIVEVEAGEAEWNLDTLESLFDFYFVQPALTAKRRAALDAKLKDAGKPPLK